MKKFILAILTIAFFIPLLSAQPAGYDENFRKIGENHNLLIKHLLNKLSSTPTYNEVLRLASNRVQQMDRKSKFYTVYQDNSKLKQYTDGFWNSNNKAAYVKEYLPSNADAYVDQLMNAAVMSSHEQRVAEMESIIENIINDPDLETPIKNALLYGAATGISSSALWSGMEGAIIWKNAEENPEASDAALAAANNGDDESIIGDDVSGAIGGGLAGGAAGVILGPGSGVTAAGGAIVMGGGGSIKTAVKKIWNWFWS